MERKTSEADSGRLGEDDMECVECGVVNSGHGCVHQGTWHSQLRDCRLTCLKLSTIGKCHWSCCLSTSRESNICPKSSHVFGPTDKEQASGGGYAGEGMFGTSDVPRFTVNLDAPPSQRWRHIVSAYKEQVREVLGFLDEILGEGVVRSMGEKAVAALTKLGKVYYSAELKAIAKQAEIPLGQVVMLQIAYEAFACCTSIVAHVGGAGQVATPFHIRTMDWDLQQLQALTIEVDFVRDAKVLFTAATWPGYVGVLTGMRRDAFSVSVNYRRSEQGDQNMVKGVMKNMWKGLFQSSWPVSFLVREVLAQDPSYAAACASLQHSELMATTYLIVAGTREGEGRVITRGRSGKEAWPEYMCTAQRHGQYVVQANMDWFRCDDAARLFAEGAERDLRAGKLVPGTFVASKGGKGGKGEESSTAGSASKAKSAKEAMEAQGAHMWQDICDSRLRRSAARAALASLGESVTPSDLWLLLSTPPCLAHDTV